MGNENLPLPPVREEKLASPPTTEEARAANAGEYAGSTRTVGKVGRNKILQAVLAGGAVVAGGAVINEQVNDLPVSASTIVADAAWPWNLGKSAVGDIKGLFNKETPVPSTFDNNAEKINFGDNNIKRVEGLSTIKFDERSKTITATSPFVIPPGTTASLDKSIYEVRGLKHNEPRITVPAGTEIVLPKGMHYRLVGGNPDLGQDPNLVYGLTTLYYNRETNRSVMLNFYLFDETKRDEIPLSTKLPITPYKELYPNGSIIWDSVNVDYWLRLPTSDGMTPIATTTLNQLVHVIPSGFSGKKLNENRINSNDIGIQLQQQDGKLVMINPNPAPRDTASTK